eukprot:4845441-Amphidinium_carterae.1
MRHHVQKEKKVQQAVGTVRSAVAPKVRSPRHLSVEGTQLSGVAAMALSCGRTRPPELDKLTAESLRDHIPHALSKKGQSPQHCSDYM